MSNTPFVESLSNDPVERAIARRVNRILHDPGLDRSQREELVRKAQKDLLHHRRQKSTEQKLVAHVKNTPIPRGGRPQAVMVRDGVIQIGVSHPKLAFFWLDAGQAPTGVAANRPAFRLPNPSEGGRKGPRKDPITERRKAMAEGRA